MLPVPAITEMTGTVNTTKLEINIHAHFEVLDMQATFLQKEMATGKKDTIHAVSVQGH